MILFTHITSSWIYLPYLPFSSSSYHFPSIFVLHSPCFPPSFLPSLFVLLFPPLLPFYISSLFLLFPFYSLIFSFLPSSSSSLYPLFPFLFGSLSSSTLLISFFLPSSLFPHFPHSFPLHPPPFSLSSLPPCSSTCPPRHACIVCLYMLTRIKLARIVRACVDRRALMACYP